MPLHPVDPLEQDERDAILAEVRYENKRAADYVQGLRDLADFLDSRPDLVGSGTSGVTVYWFAHIDGDDAEGAFVEKALSLGINRVDATTGSYYNSELLFGPHKFQVTRPIQITSPKKAAFPPHPLA